MSAGGSPHLCHACCVEVEKPRNIVGSGRWEFFVSYTTADQAWAEWVAWQLEAAGYQVLVQAWDMVAGSNWSARMQDGMRDATRTVAVLSEAYLTSVYGRQEWQAAAMADPDGLARKLLPVRVEDCARPGLLGQVVSVDVFRLPARDARDRLLAAVRAAVAGRAKPVNEPAFPGPLAAAIPPQAPSARSAPAFPGNGRVGDRSAAPSLRRAVMAEPQGFRAFLVGVAGYDDERLPTLPWLPGDLGFAAESLERVGYRTEVHDGSRTSLAAIKAAIQAVIGNAASDETLLILLAGNGVHHQGRDYLVPSDASVGYQPFWDLCVPLDWTAAIAQSPARNILILVDGICAYDADIRALVTGDGWGNGVLEAVAGHGVAYLFCEPTGPGTQSPLTRALAGVLAQDPVPGTLRDLQDSLKRQMGDAGSLRAMTLCDPGGFLPFPGSRTGAAGTGLDHPWCRAAERHHAWSLVADGPSFGDLRGAAIDLVARLARDRDQTAELLTGDPWSGPGVALHMTRRVEFLVGRLAADGDPLSPAEATLLVALPFLYEAFWARVAAEAAVVCPEDLDVRAASGPRAEFGAFARRYPRLLRRAGRAQRAGQHAPAAAIGWWLLHRWVAWRPESYQSGTLPELLGGLGAGSLASEVLDEQRVGELLAALRAEPEFLGRTDRLVALGDTMYVGAASPVEQPVRGRLVGYVLAVGQRMALDAVALPDVVAGHVGVGDPVDLADLHDTLQRAEWQQRGRATRALAARCRHQAVQVALERHAATLDRLLGEVHRAAGEFPALAMLPTHATADGVRAADVGGRPVYSSAGAQFRLAEDSVQELLMGEQLYGNRSLAVRELYQNALDACRYRRARQDYLERTTGERPVWEGRIEFQQSLDVDGNPYLECRDNGIGMGLRELTDLFAEAGTRSVDMPEVVEEMVAWAACDPPVEFFPNSRFGIGVLSYFMIADEITIDTCRAGLDDRPGDHLHVTIAGPGNLFRVQNLGPGKKAGTTRAAPPGPAAGRGGGLLCGHPPGHSLGCRVRHLRGRRRVRAALAAGTARRLRTCRGPGSVVFPQTCDDADPGDGHRCVVVQRAGGDTLGWTVGRETGLRCRRQPDRTPGSRPVR